MANKLIEELINSDFENIIKINKNGVEFWEARELMPILGYEI